MHHPTDRITHTTAFVTPVVEHWAGTRNSSMGPLHEGSIRRPIAPLANALTMELHLPPAHFDVEQSEKVRHNDGEHPPPPPPPSRVKMATHSVCSDNPSSTSSSCYSPISWQRSIPNTESNNMASLSWCRKTSFTWTWTAPGGSSLLVSLVESGECWMVTPKPPERDVAQR